MKFGEGQVNEFLEVVVSSDTPSEWAEVRNQMPWNFADPDSSKVAALNLSELDTDVNDQNAVLQKIKSSPEGTIWGEFYFDPFLTISESFDPHVLSSHQLIRLSQNSIPNGDLNCLYRSDPATDDCPEWVTSYVVVACPRCHLMFTKGDEDIYLDLDEDWIQDDCFACDGSGEWVYELL